MAYTPISIPTPFSTGLSGLSTAIVNQESFVHAATQLAPQVPLSAFTDLTGSETYSMAGQGWRGWAERLIPSFGKKPPADNEASVDSTQAVELIRKYDIIDNEGKIREDAINGYLALFSAVNRRSINFVSLLTALPDDLTSKKANEGSFFDPTNPKFIRSFIRERQLLATAHKEDLNSLTYFYVMHFGRVMHEINGDILADKSAMKDDILIYKTLLAPLLVMFEALQHEEPSLVDELRHHLDMEVFLDIRKMLARKYGSNPSVWEKAVEAYEKRESGQELRIGLSFNRAGDSKLAATPIPKEIAIKGPLPWSEHPLFAAPVSLEPSKVGGFDKLEPGFIKVATHDDSALYYKEEFDHSTKTQKVVITGDIETLAEMCQRLAAANGGFELGHSEFFFPFNNVVSHISLNYVYELVDGMCQCNLFANLSELTFHLNPETMKPEITFTKIRDHLKSRHEDIANLDNFKIFEMWKWTLARYLEDTKRIHEISRSVDPNKRAITETMRALIGQRALPFSPILPIPSDDELEQNYYDADVGLKVDRKGTVTGIFVRYYGHFPTGTFGPNTRKLCPVTEVEGTLNKDGSGLNWKVTNYGPERPDILARHLPLAFLSEENALPDELRQHVNKPKFPDPVNALPRNEALLKP